MILHKPYRQDFMIGDLVMPKCIIEDDDYRKITKDDISDYGKIIINIRSYPGGEFRYYGISVHLYDKCQNGNCDHSRYKETIDLGTYSLYTPCLKRPIGIYCQDCPMRSVGGICKDCCEISNVSLSPVKYFQLRDRVTVLGNIDNTSDKKEILGRVLINEIYLFKKPNKTISEEYIEYKGIILSANSEFKRKVINSMMNSGLSYNSLRLWNRSDTILTSQHISVFCHDLCIHKTKNCYKTCKLLNYV